MFRVNNKDTRPTPLLLIMSFEITIEQEPVKEFILSYHIVAPQGVGHHGSSHHIDTFPIECINFL